MPRTHHRIHARTLAVASGAASACMLAVALPAAALTVAGTVPARYQLNVSPALAEIRVTFDATPALPPPAALRVFGNQSGLHDGSLHLEGSTLVFDVEDGPFLPGELVSVNLRRDVHAGAGQFLTGGYVFFFTVRSAPAAADWGPRRGTGASDVPYFIYGGDLDGDGTPDVAAPNEGTNDISVFLNPGGDGVFTTRDEFAVGDTPSSVFGEDLDNDGDVDLASADILSGTMTVLLNNGDGSFAPGVSQFVGDGCRQVHGGDFDGDNDVDLCATSVHQDRIGLFYNNGDGTFAPPVLLTDVANGPFAIRAADVDGDGHLDIVAGCQSADSLTVLLNDGDGTFSTAGRYFIGNGPWDLSGNDLDGDGDVDFACVVSFGNQLVLLWNDGAGGFATRTTRATPGFPLGVHVADVNGDGSEDVLTANYGGGSIGVYLNDGSGSVALDTLLAVTLTGSYVWAHDLDGDGDLDLSVVDEEIDSLYVFPNGGTAATGVASQEAAEPAPDALVLSIHPDPASAEAGVTFQLRGAAHGGSLELFDVRGRLVRRLELAPGAGGAREIPWNVRDANGGRLPPGVYLARLTSAGRSALRSLRLLP